MACLTRLKTLQEIAKTKKKWVYHNLYKILYNTDLYQLSYKKILLDQNLNLPVYKSTLSNQLLKLIIIQVKNQEFELKHTKNSLSFYSKTSFINTIIITSIEIILSCIFNIKINSLNTERRIAYQKLKHNWIITQWAIQSKIVNRDFTIPEHKLLYFISQNIKDQLFMDLLRQFIRCPINLHPQQKSSLYLLLEKIYLNALDRYIQKKLQKTFQTPKKSLQKQVYHYTRYHYEWLIGTNCSKTYAERLHKILMQELTNILNLKIHEVKTAISNIQNNKIYFLGYLLHNTKKDLNHINDTTNHLIISLPKEEIIKALIYYQYAYYKQGTIKLQSKTNLVKLTDHLIIKHYAQIIKRLSEMYCEIKHCGSIQFTRYLLYKSCVKSLSHKHKTTSQKIISKYKKDLKTAFLYL